MTQNLFRHEVLDAKKHSFLGSISLAQPLQLWLYAGAALLCAVLVLCFLMFGEYTRRTTVSGSLVPNLGLSTLVAPISGVVSDVMCKEGDLVHKRDGLVKIIAPRIGQDGTDISSSLSVELAHKKAASEDIGKSKLQQIDTQVVGLTKQITFAEQELVQLNAEIMTKRKQVQLGQESLNRYKKLVGSQYVSQIQMDQQENTLLAAISEQQAFERQFSERKRSIAQLRQSVSELAVQKNVQAATNVSDIASIEQERAVQQGNSGFVLESPVDGLLASRLIESGQVVQAGQTLLSVLPTSSKLEAHLLVPSSAMGFIEPGDTVLIRYQAYPYQKFGHYKGKILAITRNVVQADTQKNQMFYRIIVSIEKQSVLAYGKKEPLRPGLAVEADILGDKRKLYEWLFEPLYALKGKI